VPFILSICGAHSHNPPNPLNNLLQRFTGRAENHPIIYRPLPHQECIDLGFNNFNKIIQPRLGNEDIGKFTKQLVNYISEFRMKHYASV
jgi:hypothetical protein